MPSITTSWSRGKKCVLVPPDDVKGGLMFIKNLLEKEKFKPVIDRIYPLEKIAEAYTYVMSGEKIGNVVLTIE